MPDRPPGNVVPRVTAEAKASARMISCKIGFAETADDDPRIHLSRRCVSREASSHPADDGRRPETRQSEPLPGSRGFALLEPSAVSAFARTHLRDFSNKERNRAILATKAPPSTPASRPRVDDWGGDDGQQVEGFMQRIISSASPDLVQRMIAPAAAKVHGDARNAILRVAAERQRADQQTGSGRNILVPKAGPSTPPERVTADPPPGDLGLRRVR